jgi:hypothetical protein
MQPNRSIWEGMSLIFLPNGELLVNLSLGVSLAEAATGNTTSGQSFPLNRGSTASTAWRSGCSQVN